MCWGPEQEEIASKDIDCLLSLFYSVFWSNIVACLLIKITNEWLIRQYYIWKTLDFIPCYIHI